MKVVLIGQFIAISDYIRKIQRYLKYVTMIYPKVLEKQEAKLQVDRRTIKINSSTEIHDTETNTLQRINERKSWLFEKIKRLTIH